MPFSLMRWLTRDSVFRQSSPVKISTPSESTEWSLAYRLKKYFTVLIFMILIMNRWIQERWIWSVVNRQRE